MKEKKTQIDNDNKLSPGNVYVCESLYSYLYFYFDGRERSYKTVRRNWQNHTSEYSLINGIKILKITPKFVDFKIYKDIECKKEITTEQNKDGYYRKGRKYVMTFVDQMVPDARTKRKMKLKRMLNE